MINGGRDAPLRISERGYYEALYGPATSEQAWWSVEGVIEPDSSGHAAVRVRSYAGSDFEDGLIISSILAIRLNAEIVYD